MLVHPSLLSYVQVVLSSSWSLHAACDNVPATLPPKRRAFVDPGAAEYLWKESCCGKRWGENNSRERKARNKDDNF
jgi:hypothetical protein